MPLSECIAIHTSLPASAPTSPTHTHTLFYNTDYVRVERLVSWRRGIAWLAELELGVDAHAICRRGSTAAASPTRSGCPASTSRTRSSRARCRTTRASIRCPSTRSSSTLSCCRRDPTGPPSRHRRTACIRTGYTWRARAGTRALSSWKRVVPRYERPPTVP
jgi:hypothetical protein